MALENNKAKIVETALQMFNGRGIRSVTMDDIASAMHMSKRTLYETFANKEELLSECLKSILEGINELHRQAHRRADEPLLMAMYMLQVNADSMHRYQHLMDETEHYYPEIHHRLFAGHSEKLRGMMQLGIDYLRNHNYLRADAKTDVAVDFFCNIIQKHTPPADADLTKERLEMNEICFTYLRGLMNTESLERYEKSEPRFREVIDSIAQQQALHTNK